jgi:hypothetical protein
MGKRIATLGDRVLAAVLPRGTAGACLPTMNCDYWTDYECLSGTVYADYCTGKTNCSGVCNVGIVCTRKKVGKCS